ncbi:MAG: hypothetical protein OXM61_17400 [Candidatus Poribacteria bacterium]|nr:hypothetical protein [Candidatus Poribacteria bacterium]
MLFRLVSILISSFLLLSIGCSSQTSQDAMKKHDPSQNVDNPHFNTYRDALKSIQNDWIQANKRINAVYVGITSHQLKRERDRLLRANNTKRDIAKRKAWFTYRDAMLSDDEKQLVSKSDEVSNAK